MTTYYLLLLTTTDYKGLSAYDVLDALDEELHPSEVTAYHGE